MPKFLIVTFDGLRRDMISPELCPTIASFVASASDFPEARAVFPSETRVQVSSFVTGTFPGGNRETRMQGHGIMGNAFYDPALGFDRPLDTSDLQQMARADRIYGGNMQMAASLGDVLAAHHKKLAVVTTGTIGNAKLMNYRAAENGQPVFSVHGAHVSSPAADHDRISEKFGPVPKSDFPYSSMMTYGTDLVLDNFLAAHRPDVMVLWYSEPDFSYHFRGIGSPESLAAIRCVDQNFARILDWWQTEGIDDGWQIAALSDHGQITVTDYVDVTSEIAAAGFAAGSKIEPGIDVINISGYSGSMFVRDRDPKIIGRICDWLAEQPWCGTLFDRVGNGVEGVRRQCFDMSLLNCLNDRAPDIFYTLRTTDTENDAGYPGTCAYDVPKIPIGGGLHGGLHPIELNNLLCLKGSRFRPEYQSPLPAGLGDLAPTILHCLGIAQPDSMTGRILNEALLDDATEAEQAIETATTGNSHYRQQFRWTSVDGARLPYLGGGFRTH